MKKTLFAIIPLLFCTAMTAPTNAAPSIDPSVGSGIIFENNQKISITSERLYIDLSPQIANIRAVYTLKNTTNQADTVNSTFVASISNEWRNNFLVIDDGDIADLSMKFFSDNESGINGNWENRLPYIQEDRPLGTALSYFRYEIEGIYQTSFYFSTASPFICSTETVKSHNLYQVSHYDKVIIWAASDFRIINPSSDLTSNYFQVADIYDDIYRTRFDEMFILNPDYDDPYNIADFQYFLSNVQKKIDKGVYNIYLYDYGLSNFDGRFIATVSYTLSFAANQEKVVEVYYSYYPGYLGGYYSNYNFLYYLTPAKYWKSFTDLKIYLRLSEETPYIVHSSLKFEKVAPQEYEFSSPTLPKSELSIEFGNYRNASEYIEKYVMIPVVITLIITFLALITLSILLVRDIKKLRKLKKA